MAKGMIKSRPVHTEPRLRRGYFECRFGQLHIHHAIPPGGGFDEGIPLIALHQSPQSGSTFEDFLPFVGRDRSAYAPDLPGFGSSDPPPARPSVSDYAGAVADFCDSMRFRQVDVLGYASGSFVAIELALARTSTVRRVVCVGLPLATESERELFRRAPWPVQPTEDGGYIAAEWERTRTTDAGLPIETLARSFAEKLRNGPRAWWGLQAAFEYPARDRIGRLAQPTLIIRPRDEWWEATLRARELLPRARILDLPDVSAEAFEVAPERLAAVVRDFLRS
ncbi:MAG: alpha/beta fold hydrolase [Steroidobacteraceae bacterium]